MDRRRDGQLARQTAALGRGGDAGLQTSGHHGERQGGAMEHGRGATMIFFLRNCVTRKPSVIDGRST